MSQIDFKLVGEITNQTLRMCFAFDSGAKKRSEEKSDLVRTKQFPLNHFLLCSLNSAVVIIALEAKNRIDEKRTKRGGRTSVW